MGDVVPMNLSKRDRMAGRFEDSGHRLRMISCSQLQEEQDAKIISLDLEQKDLLLLQFRRRRLEHENLVRYKASTTMALALESGNAEITITVLVKSRLVEYYFYCPISGGRVAGSIDCRNSSGVDCLALSWREIEQMVHDQVFLKWQRPTAADAGPCEALRLPEPSPYPYVPLCLVQAAEGGPDHDSKQDTLLHRLLRKLGICR